MVGRGIVGRPRASHGNPVPNLIVPKEALLGGRTPPPNVEPKARRPEESESTSSTDSEGESRSSLGELVKDSDGEGEEVQRGTTLAI
jgi:hypothetical protein